MILNPDATCEQTVKDAVPNPAHPPAFSGARPAAAPRIAFTLESLAQTEFFLRWRNES